MHTTSMMGEWSQCSADMLKSSGMSLEHFRVSKQNSFCRPRPVPYAMRQVVEEELLQKQVEQKVIEPIQYADWTAPIVPVRQKDHTNLW